MKKSNLIITTAVLTLSCSMAFAGPVDHQHGERGHSHSLPNNGMAHNHGGISAAPITNTSTSPVNSPSGRLTPMSALTPDQKQKVHGLSMLGGAAVLKAVMPKYNKGILGIGGHRTEAKRDIKSGCANYARRLQQNEKQVDLYHYVLNNCVQTAFSVVKFNDAGTDMESSKPRTNIGSTIKVKIRIAAEKEINKLGDKIKNEFQKGVSDILGFKM